jgi:hypothetical protein
LGYHCCMGLQRKKAPGLRESTERKERREVNGLALAAIVSQFALNVYFAVSIAVIRYQQAL